MLEFTRLKKNLKKDFTGLKTIRIALLCDSSSQLLRIALKGYGFDEQLNFDIYESDYDQIDQQVFDSSSDLYSFAAEYVFISLSPLKLRKSFQKLDKDDKRGFADSILMRLKSYVAALKSVNPKTKIICSNINELDDGVFGNYANKTRLSFVYQQRKLNFLIAELAIETPNLYINDIQSLQNRIGRETLLNNKNYINADSIWSLDFLPLLAKNITDVVLATSGYARKCLILDLDNTVWGGVIGDDGINGIQVGDLGLGKAYSELQLWAKELKKRGIIVCICSKNEEIVAKEPFEKHPDMVLRLDDIAVFIANWETKVDNIHYIKSVLQVGYDSMVFIDDNPFERNMVKSEIPEIVVPELPEDPVDYLSYLLSLNLFDVNSYTDEDEQRTSLYQQEAERSQLQKVYKNEAEFLKKLNMVSEVQPLNEFNIPRSAQLSQRSNQFNLRTIRYTEESMKHISESDDYSSLVLNLKDSYGEYGVISVIILKQEEKDLFIENWFMSCRVLKRGVEKFVLNEIVDIAQYRGCDTIVGEYLPTAKNVIVKDHYRNLGFDLFSENKWVLRLSEYEPKQVYIAKAVTL